MTVITLTTDFGLDDPEASVLKGVIWSIAPTVQVADLSHAIPPHDILEAALLLGRVAPYFQAGTIHVAVVDPGVGTSRRAIAAKLGSQYFVGPDNGLVSLLMTSNETVQQPNRFIKLDRPEYWLPEVSHVFHGRDVFAPVAAHLAAGVSLSTLGSPIDDPVRLEIASPVPTSDGWLGLVIHIDHFGNLSTNLSASHINREKEVIIKIKGEQIFGLVSTFGERPAGALIALLDSSGSLAISKVNGSAAQSLGAVVGDKIELLVAKV